MWVLPERHRKKNNSVLKKQSCGTAFLEIAEEKRNAGTAIDEPCRLG